MHPLISEKQEQIAALCRRYSVRSLEVCGSAARGGDFDAAASDADFLVEFDPDSEAPPLAEYFGFREALAQMLNRPVDLIERRAVRNPYVQASIDQVREVIYAA